MHLISYLTLCKLIDAAKKLKKSNDKKRFLSELTSLLNWSVQSEEFKLIPISDDFLCELFICFTNNGITIDYYHYNGECESIDKRFSA